jgi:hypothetical protein
MIRAFRGELTRLIRRRVLVITGLVVIVFGIVGSAVTLSAARPAAEVGPEAVRTRSFEQLADAGGGSDIFRLIAAFAGTFLFVVFVGLITVELSRGTVRTMLLRQPRRLQLLAGKLLAVLTFAAATLAAAEIVTWIAARAQASGAGVDAGAWASVDGLVAALGDYAVALVWIVGYAVIGTTLGLLLRSVPLALGVGVAWAGPGEHLIRDGWPTAERVFPGLSLEALAAGGTPEVTATAALATVLAYVLVGATVSSLVFQRRDIVS